jgi:hypothetical protein
LDGVIRTHASFPTTIYLAITIWGVTAASCFIRDWKLGAAYASRPFIFSIPVGLGLFTWGMWSNKSEPANISAIPHLANAQTVSPKYTRQYPTNDGLPYQDIEQPKQATETHERRQAIKQRIQLQATDCELNINEQRWCRSFYFEGGKQPERELIAHVANQPLQQIETWPENACPSYSVFDDRNKYGQVVNIRKGAIECGEAHISQEQSQPVHVCVQWYNYDCVVPGASAWAAIDRGEAPGVSAQ